jgi:hypothetical protein
MVDGTRSASHLTVEGLLEHIRQRMIEDRHFEIMEEFGAAAFTAFEELPQIVQEDDAYGCKADDIALMLDAGLLYADQLDGNRVYRWSRR